MRTKLLLAIGLLLATNHLFGQANPAGLERTVPLKLGFGYSNFDSDWNGRVAGPSVWMNWNFRQYPGFLSRLGIEGQAHHLVEDRTNFQLRYNTFAGGPVYNFTIGQQRRVQPYAGFLIGLGDFAFSPSMHGYSHDSRTIYGPTGGADLGLIPRVKLRAGFDYQYWPDLFHNHALTPYGFTIGGVYDFGDRRRGGSF